MDFFNQTADQVRGLFASMTPGARVTAALLLAVVVVSIGFLFQQVSAGPDEYLFGGDPIGRGRLPRMEAAMSAAGIDYSTEGTRIRVSRTNKNAAIAAIAAAGELPPEFHALMDDAIDGGSLFDFRDTKLQRVRAAREKQVSDVLSAYPWIDRANVIHTVTEQSGLNRRRHATAAVSIMPAVGEWLTPHRLRNVKDFVSKAFDVPVDDIAVTNLGGDSGGGDGSISPADFDHPGRKIEAQVEMKIRSQILSQLNFIPGVRVEVNAEIDPTSAQEVVETKPEGEAVALHRKSSDEEDTHTSGNGGDRVGQVANGPTGIGTRDEALASRQDQSSKTINTSETSQGIGVRTTKTVTSGYALKQAEASVAVPMSYVREYYRQEREAIDGEPPEELDANALAQAEATVKSKIENIVQPLLPKLALGENEYKQVKVTFVVELPKPELPVPSTASGALAWTSQHASTLAMAALAVFGLVMLRSMASSGGKDGAVSGLPSLQLDGETLPDSNSHDDEEHARPKLKLKKPDTLKDDLSDMVSTDPDAAAAILRSWINNSNSNNKAA